MADGQTVSVGLGLRRHVAPPTGLQRKTRLLPGAAPALAASLTALLARNAMLKKAPDQERPASADMRRSLLGDGTGLPKVQDATLSFRAEDPVTVMKTTVPAPSAKVATSNPQTDPDDAGLAAGYPNLGYGLTQRHQILGLVLAGHPSKNIAADLGISQRTVESHRAAIMQRTGATSLPALARLAIGAEVGGDCRP